MNFSNGALHIAGVPVARLIEEFGSPLYVYDRSAIDRQIERIRGAFARLPLQPFYAAKANSNLTILRIIASHGFGCDAVSPGEVFLARKAGFPPERIWFTCSNVSDRDLLLLSDPEVVINVNSMSEVDRVIALQLPNPIALRVNPDVGAGHHRDVVTGGFGVKFGLEIAQLADARMMAADAGLTVVGLHAHIGSGVNEVRPLLESARTLVALADDFPGLRWLNFGGGMGVPYRPGDAEFPIDEYGRELEGVAGPCLKKRGLTAIVEPGRYVVAGAGVLLSTVTAWKISGGFIWVGCDTGFNHLVRPSRYGAYHHIVNATRGDDSWLRDRMSGDPYDFDSGAVVAGNICESGDVFTREGDDQKPRRLAPTHVGDVLAFCDAGAYGFSMASHYNARLLPAEVLVDGDEAVLIRARQTFEELLAGQEDVPMSDSMDRVADSR